MEQLVGMYSTRCTTNWVGFFVIEERGGSLLFFKLWFFEEGRIGSRYWVDGIFLLAWCLNSLLRLRDF